MKCFRLSKAEGKGNHGLQKLLNMYDILTSIKRDGSSPITGTYVMTFYFEVTKCMYYYNLTFKLNIHGHILGKCTYLKRTYRHYIYIFIFRQKGLHEKLPSCMDKRTNLVHIINTLNMLWFHKFIVEYQFSWNLLVSWFNKPAFIEVLYIVTHC